MRLIVLGMVLGFSAFAQEHPLLTCYERIGSPNGGKGYEASVVENERGQLFLDVTMCDRLWHGECFGDSNALIERLEVKRTESGFQTEAGGLVRDGQDRYFVYVGPAGGQRTHQFSEKQCQ